MGTTGRRVILEKVTWILRPEEEGTVPWAGGSKAKRGECSRPRWSHLEQCQDWKKTKAAQNQE